MRIRLCIIAGLGVLLAGCGAQRVERNKITVAAASNFQQAFAEVATAFERETGIRVVMSYASTAQLAQQISNGAPFDVFASADVEHLNALVARGHVLPESRRIFAQGTLVMWAPKLDVKGLEDLVKPEVKLIAVANPETAPYGRAAVEALKAAGIWEKVQGRITYANSVNQVRQLAASGNADVALTSRSLVRGEKTVVVGRPIDHAIGVVTHATNAPGGRRFVEFVTDGGGSRLLEKFGYLKP